MHKIALLGTGLIGDFYTSVLHGFLGAGRVHAVCSRRKERAEEFARKWGVPKWTTDMQEAIRDKDVDTVVVGLPNNLHLPAVLEAARAGKAVMCTKPLARNAQEAKQMLEAVEKAGVFAGYLEDLVYPPKTLKALEAARRGALGKVLWTRSRETHSGPHSDWFWDLEQAGGGAIVDMGCHCIEIARNFIGKEIKPVEVVCWAATQVHPIPAEDHAIGLVRYANGAIGQFEVSWSFRGGMDLRDEVAGTEGTVWLDHFLRTGVQMFTAVGSGGYVAEKAEGEKGWLFPVGDEANELGYVHMFKDMFECLDARKAPMETFYDGYVVNAIMDAAYKSVKSKRWEPVDLKVWRGLEKVSEEKAGADYDAEHVLIKRELLPDGRPKLILKNKKTGKVIEKIEG